MRRALGVAALVVALAGGGRDARADLTSTLEVIGYVSSMGAGALATAVNGSYLAFGEPAPRSWRIFGFVAGGLDLAWGGVVLAVGSDTGTGVALGSVALALGVASLVTAILVDQEDDRPRVVPIGLQDGVGLGLAGRF